MALFGRGILVLISSMIFMQIASAASPNWKLNGSYTNIAATVQEVESVEDAVLIKIDTGTESKLAAGSVCQVFRGDDKIAEVVIVEAKRKTSVAMKLTGSAVKAGDKIYITRQPDSQ